jgi:tetrahydromethanopterin S-methyltransferase subunit G
MGLFKKKSTDPSEIERLKSEIASMTARLDAADSAKQQLDNQVEGLATRLDTPPEQPPPPPPPEPTVHPDEFRAIVGRVGELAKRLDNPTPVEPPPAAVSPDELEAVNARVHANTEQLSGLDGVEVQVQTLTTRLDQLDARMTSISNELANQITELSSDIEALNGKDPASELVDRLRDTQVKLANEQARYQIAFREDLAHLADFLKHS